jgi:hypothetical protein
MITGIDKKQFDELYNKLPEDLQDAIYASETGENVDAICERNKIPELFAFLIDQILCVYLGILPLDKFMAEVGERTKEKPGAKQIASEIDRFLVFPYKDSISKIYAAAQPGTQPAATPSK